MPDAPPANQRTLAGAATISGRGLFTGEPVTATLRPAEPDTGFVFVRTDLPGAKPVPGRVEYVVSKPRHTALQRGEAVIETTEHCLSGLVGMGVDNAVIELDAPELPSGDGSATPFVEAVAAAGVVEQPAPRRPLVITEPITVRDGDAMIAAMPTAGDGMDLLYDLDYGEDAPIGRQIHAYTLESETYRARIAPARTFAMRHEAEAMRDQGLFEHVSLKDVLVIGEHGPIENAYRFDDEPVRHKLLDLIGDLALVGRPIRGRILASKSGHALNQRLARALIDLDRAETHSGDHLPAPAMDIRQIMRLLPHRYPMVLVDRVLEMDGDRRAVGIKNVSVNEPFFQGHYPGSPIMPGVLIVEAMSQLSGLMLSQKLERTGKVAVLLSLDKVKIRRPVVPGDQLVMESECIRATTRFGDVDCRAFVAGKLVAQARVRFMMVDAEQD
ncbi:MAG: UDP-3-O-[3-hydroxymyristoyl] N-acetylglucosamine deacetylase [Planctomycetota bacterium]|nr:MAG: UDP-3-O-[3-hydroxymyristoyl] N-acetylglucosamine deacetylase [Planctomycetota bacterium]